MFIESRHIAAIGIALSCSIAFGCSRGQEGRHPADSPEQRQPTGTAGRADQPSKGPVTVVGCLQPGDDAGSYVVRIADSGQPGSGNTTSQREPWPGTRAYEVVPDRNADLKQFVGSWVQVNGSVAPAADAPTGETDQQQARRGNAYAILRAASIAPATVAGSTHCPAGAAQSGNPEP